MDSRTNIYVSSNEFIVDFFLVAILVKIMVIWYLFIYVT